MIFSLRVRLLTCANNASLRTRTACDLFSGRSYLHDHLFPVQLDANRDRVRQEAKLMHRTVVDAQLQRLPVNLERQSNDRISNTKRQTTTNNQQQCSSSSSVLGTSVNVPLCTCEKSDQFDICIKAPQEAGNQGYLRYTCSVVFNNSGAIFFF